MGLSLGAGISAQNSSGLSGIGLTFPGEGAGSFAFWNFISNQAWWNGAYVGALANTPNWTFTRASTAYYRNSAGVLIPFNSGVLRTGDRGALIEGAGTNLCLQSQTFDNASWSKTNVTVTADAAVAPDGTMTADKVEATATAVTDFNQTVTLNATACTFSIYVKKGSGATDFNRFHLRNNTTATNLITGTFNYDTGAWTYTTGSTGVEVIALANGWWRLTFSASSGITSGNQMKLYAGASAFSESAGEFAYLWGAQLEVTAYASSYVPTTTGSATRAADSLTATGVTGLDYPLSLYAEFERGVDTGGVEEFLNVDSGSIVNRGRILIDATDDPRAVMTTASAAVANINGFSVLSAGAVRKFAARFATDNVNAASNGTLGTTDTSATAPSTPTTIRFGANASGANYCYGYLRRLALFSRALSDGELQALTAA